MLALGPNELKVFEGGLVPLSPRTCKGGNESHVWWTGHYQGAVDGHSKVIHRLPILPAIADTKQ